MVWIQDETQQFTINFVPSVPEGFLQITNIDAPTSAFGGDTVNITLTLTNIGMDDYFLYEAIDNTTGEVLMQENSSFFPSESKDISFSFIMPSRDITIQLNTYHEE